MATKTSQHPTAAAPGVTAPAAALSLEASQMALAAPRSGVAGAAVGVAKPLDIGLAGPIPNPPTPILEVLPNAGPATGPPAELSPPAKDWLLSSSVGS